MEFCQGCRNGEASGTRPSCFSGRGQSGGKNALSVKCFFEKAGLGNILKYIPTIKVSQNFGTWQMLFYSVYLISTASKFNMAYMV